MAGRLDHVNLRLVETFEELRDMEAWFVAGPMQHGRMGVDTESTGLSLRHDRVRMIQFGDLNAGWALPWEWWSGYVRDVVQRYRGRYTLHNVPFDYPMIRKMGVDLPRDQLDDTLPLVKMIEPHLPAGLKPQSGRHVDKSAGQAQADLDEAIARFGWAGVDLRFQPYWCVPLDTEILTRRGWLHHDKVVPGDETLGYFEGKSVWTTIRKTTSFTSAPIVQLGNSYWNVECTPQHKWLMRKGVAQNVKLLPLEDGWKDKGTTKLITAAPAVGGDSEMTPDEAAILAWLLSDGSIHWQRKETQTSPIATIVQHPKKFAAEIRELLKREGAYISEHMIVKSGCLSFYVSAPYVQRLWEKSGLRAQSVSDLVLSLSTEARHAWWDAWILAEGTQGKNIITQNFGPKMDALALCAYLEGYRPMITSKNEKCGSLRYTKRELTPQKSKVTTAGTAPVWCPTTDLGTWTARDRKGNIFLTGNTYAALDPVITHHLWEVRKPVLEAQHPRAWAGWEVENAVQFVLVDMMDRGMPIDVPYATEMRDKFNAYCGDLRAWVQQEYGVSITSDQSLIRVMAEQGVEFSKLTAGGALSLDKEVLEDVEHPLADMIRKYRKISRISGTYLDYYIKNNVDGVVHPQIRSTGARTGRMSVADPNLQNLPRVSDNDPAATVVRNAMVSREGHTQMRADFDQIEMRIYAHLSQDPGLIAAFNEKEDFFVTLAKMVFQDDTITKKSPLRQLVKNVGYGKIYGAGVEKQAKTAGVPTSQAQYANDKFDSLYPGGRAFQQQVYTEVAKNRAQYGESFILCPLSGRRHVADKGKEYKLVNHLIQGMAAFFFKTKLVELSYTELEPYMILPVHDEIITDVPDHFLPQAAEILLSVMNDSTTFRVPITAGLTIGKRWGEKIEYETAA